MVTPAHEGEEKPWVVDFDRTSNTTLLDLVEIYEDVLERYGILHLRGLVRKVMGPAMETFTPEALWTAWEFARVETVTARFPWKQEVNLSIKAWRKRNAKAVYGVLPDSVWNDPVPVYWRTVDKSLSQCMPEVTGLYEGGGEVLPEGFTTTYGMIMDGAAEVARRVKDLEDAAGVSTVWRQHHEDFGGPRNLLCRHPALKEHKLLGIASPLSYFYAGGPFSSFQWHWEDFWMPSVNFLTYGSAKHWMGARADDTRKVWSAIETVGRALGSKPDEKKFLISPNLLEQLQQVSSYPVLQSPGDAVISAAGATHGGCNLGDNLAEAVNFADEQWLARASDMLAFYEARDRTVPRAVLEVAGLV